jgi:hypothetical protein
MHHVFVETEVIPRRFIPTRLPDYPGADENAIL